MGQSMVFDYTMVAKIHFLENGKDVHVDFIRNQNDLSWMKFSCMTAPTTKYLSMLLSSNGDKEMITIMKEAISSDYGWMVPLSKSQGFIKNIKKP